MQGSEVATEPEALMADGGRAIVEGVERLGAGWVVGAVTHIVDAWGELDDTARAKVLDDARSAGDRAAARVVTELDALFALPALEQRSTPLAIVRTLRFEATDVLRTVGVPEVVRDEYEIRAFPDDIYGIVPKAITELGDEDLGGALLAWGIGKARAIRERPQPGQGVEL
jgi:hypothetical protein